jgi:hypothetical protein
MGAMDEKELYYNIGWEKYKKRVLDPQTTYGSVNNKGEVS